MKYFFLFFFFISTSKLFSQNGYEIGLIQQDYNYILKGKIGNSDVEMHYSLNKTIKGYYFYEKHYQYIEILGHIKNDTIKIFEFDSEINKTGVFIGTVSKDSTYIGNWINLLNKKVYSFDLKGKYLPFINYRGFLYIKKSNHMQLYDITDSLDTRPYYIENLEWIYKNDTLFTVYLIRGFGGNPANPFGNCGASEDEKVFYFQIDNNRNILKKSSYLIGSCYKNYTNYGAEWDAQKNLRIKGSNDHGDYIILFNRDAPENGLTIKYLNKK